MAIDPNEFDDIAKRFDKLTPEDRDELLERLEKRRSSGTAFSNASNNTKQSLFDAMNRRGMAGSIKDGPEDWSTDPKYLEGLGQDVE